MRTVPGRTDSVVVVGAGLGGLSAALHLAGAGRQVTVVERAGVPGGRAGVIIDGGYRFDTGPTVLTMPDLVADALHAVGERLDDRLTLHRLDPAYRARFADGSSIDVRAGVDAMCAEIREQCGPRDAARYLDFVAYLRRLYDVELPHFIARNLDSPLQLVRPSLARLVALGGFRRLARKVGSFFADERLHRLFSFQAMYAGLSPASALAIYSVITYMDCVEGVWFPQGGMHAVPVAMADAAAEHGVTFRYDTTVARVETSNGRATAVVTEHGERIRADVVVINADLPTAQRELLDRTPRRMDYSPSAVVLHAGSTRRHTDAHHTIDFGVEWERTFDDVIGRGEQMRDPSFLITTPTTTDPALAPAGRHTNYVLFPAPNTTHPQPSRERLRDRIHETLEARGYKGFSDSVECEHLTTPHDWAAQGLTAGAPFAASHRFTQTGPFRPSTLDRRVENLVYAGSNTQPGVGVPMVLISGRLAAQRITGRG